MEISKGRYVEVWGLESDVPAALENLKSHNIEQKSDAEAQRILQDYCREFRRMPSLDSFFGEDPAYEWVVPDMLEYGDRLVLTGTEGVGKSTLIRQWLMQISCGIHPLTGQDIEPVPVLLVDLENGKGQLQRELSKLQKAAGNRFDPSMFRLISKPEGWDLLDEDNQDRMRGLVELSGAGIVGISPLYKSFIGDERDDELANRITGFLNELRETCALITEAHTPHAAAGSHKRPQRPIGSSVWMRWPEFGLYLGNDGTLRHWRGARDADREWPAKLNQGGKWPWTALTPERSENVHWRRIKKLWEDTGTKPSARVVEEKLGIKKSTAARVISDHQDDWPATP
ncbi:AAA family ATPase [Micromonospora sp. NBC_00330]|uniref:AAA family ATPase n=1 Tax=Micromonospora sp. NBC_00330 TaxID=2903585 RepID=UPI002E2A9EA9|nr:AAA family ATPase [Micromonospora sp. NBC_00330]